MRTIDDEIRITDGVICRYLDSINDSTRGMISQDILAHLKNLVEHVMLKYYSPYENVDDTEKNIEKAAEHAQTDGRLKVLYRFRNYLDIVASHYTLDEDSSERLMLKYYDYLFEIRNLFYRDFHIVILHNLDKFPLNLDTALQEYYSKIAERIDGYEVQLVGEGEKYYIQKIKPFYVRGRKYNEVTFTTAKDRENKAGRVIAFTKLPVISNYASRFYFVNENIEILGKTMPVLLIVGWEVSLRGCEFKNFSFIITGSKREVTYPEQRTVCRFITEKGYTLTEIMDFPDGAYRKLTNSWRSAVKTGYFFDVLDRCRRIIRSEQPGQNILRYLLYIMHNAIIKAQWQDAENGKLSGLHLSNRCIPFDKMPFIQSPVYHNPRHGALFNCIPTRRRKHELLARQLRNNTEIAGRIFTPLEELAHYGDVKRLANKYNYTLWFGHRDRSQIIVDGDFAYINEYKLDTCDIIKKLIELSKTEDPDYTDAVDIWLLLDDYEVDCGKRQ